MIELGFEPTARAALKILCLGAHSDDIEIGCGATILRLTTQYPGASVRWIVFSSDGTDRGAEAHAGARRFLARAAEHHVEVKGFRQSCFPYAGGRIKEDFEALKAGGAPDIIFTHYRHDLHQDHKLVSDLTWNTFRRSLILEYEIPKWDGDLGAPNCYVRIPEELAELKIQSICETFRTQHAKPWFTADTFRSLMRLRGIEANTQLAEAFYARKVVLG